jgi:hypothetical protein
MSNRSLLAACLVTVSSALVAVAACSSDNSPSAASDAGTDGTASSSGGSGGGGSGSSSGASSSGSSSGGREPDGGISDSSAETGGSGLLVDNMTAATGTRIALVVPGGDTPGSYYAYSDYPVSAASGDTSSVTGTGQLKDVHLTNPITNADGSQIVGELCFGGTVVGFAGLGMNLVYGNPPDATPESGLSSPIPFDASHYSGVSFYINVDPADGPTPTIRFGMPDTQTADPTAWPTSACTLMDGGKCDDDFGGSVTYTPGMWSKVSFKWNELALVGFGPNFSSIKTNQLIGMKWQANGAGADAAAVDSFNFCISTIYFTP